MGSENIHIKRLENWPSLLSEFLERKSKEEFAWGINDCLIFPADCVAALTGVDFAAPYRGKYSTESEALEYAARLNGIELPEGETCGTSAIITAFLGERRQNALQGQRGDVVVALIGDHITGGIIDDTGRRAAFVTFKGLIRLPIKATMRVWGY